MAYGSKRIGIPRVIGFRPKLKVTTVTDQIVPSGTTTKVTLDKVVYDELGEYDPAVDYRFTAKETGYYLVSGQITMYSALTASVMHDLSLAGSRPDYFMVVRGYTEAAGYVALVMSATFYLTRDEYFSLYIYQTSGSDVTVIGDDRDSFLCIHKIAE